MVVMEQVGDGITALLTSTSLGSGNVIDRPDPPVQSRMHDVPRITNIVVCMMDVDDPPPSSCIRVIVNKGRFPLLDK